MPERSIEERRARFRALHQAGLFVMPNAWDVGSARLLEHAGFPALATTSSGHAAALGRTDLTVTLDELLEHAAAIAGAVSVPVNVDSERCFADDPAGVARTVDLIAGTGAAGCSIEDYDPATGAIDSLAVAAERVAAAAEAAKRHGLVLTGRAENHLYGVDDLDDTVARLVAYRDAGADVVYAPGLVEAAQVRQLVERVGVPVNVLALRAAPSVPELRAIGVRRVSTGGALTRVAYGALQAAAAELHADGTYTYLDRAPSSRELDAALSGSAAD